MPMDGINYHEEPVLGMIRNREEFIKTLDGLNEEHLRYNFDFPCLRIFSDSNQVLIESLKCVKVLVAVIIELIHGAANYEHLE